MSWWNIFSSNNDSTNIEDPNVPLSNAEVINDEAESKPVREKDALTVSAVFRSVMLLADSMAGLPIKVFDIDGTENNNHENAELLRQKPNDKNTPFTFYQCLMIRALLWGNAYAQIRRDGAGRAVSMILRSPDDVEVVPVGDRLAYRVKIGETFVPVPDRDMIHVPGLCFDGDEGMKAIRHCAQKMLSLAVFMETSSVRLHKNGTMPSGQIIAKKGFSEKAVANLKRTFNRVYSGVKNAGKTLFLDNEMEFKPISMTFKDAEMLESRRFQVEEVARFFGIPLHMIGELTKSTSWGTGIEQQNIAFVVFSLNPWLIRFEQELNRKIMRGKGYLKFKVQGLLRGDSAARKEFYASAIQHGWMKPNEARKLEDLPTDDPLGDKLYISANLIPLENAGRELTERTNQ